MSDLKPPGGNLDAPSATLAEWDRRLERVHARAVTIEALDDLIRQRDSATAKARRAEKVADALRRMIEYPTPLRGDFLHARAVLNDWDKGR